VVVSCSLAGLSPAGAAVEPGRLRIVGHAGAVADERQHAGEAPGEAHGPEHAGRERHARLEGERLAARRAHEFGPGAGPVAHPAAERVRPGLARAQRIAQQRRAI
jgi:hypothetical protein